MDNIFDDYQEREEETTSLAIQSLKIKEISEDDEEISRVSWTNLTNNERDCELITGFTPEEFLTLYNIVVNSIGENIGRGPKDSVSKYDKLVMVLCYLKHYETIDKMKDTFSVSRANLDIILKRTIDDVYPILYNHYVKNIEDGNKEDVFSDSKYIVNTTFQPINIPTGTRQKKVYYSKKYQSYGFKSQCIHDRKGRVVSCIAGEKGSVSNLELCQDHIDELKIILEENNSILADNSYQGLEKDNDVIVPYQNPTNKHQLMFNKRLTNQLKISEQYYERMKSRYRIMTVKYRKSRYEYEKIFKLCTSLTNYHVLEHPL